MKRILNYKRFLGAVVVVLLMSLFVLPDFAEARRGGSFGGSRGGSMRQSKPRTQQQARQPGAAQRSTSKTSFGGNRITKQQATAKYGTPRRTETTTGTNAQGGAQTYNVNHYGGYSSGLMTGYMLGHTSMLWMMPFHPAFYYSRPYYVENEDGTVDVYPPTFSFMRIIIGLVVLWIIIAIIRSIIRKARGRSNVAKPKYTSFS